MTGDTIPGLAYVRETAETVERAVETVTAELKRRGFGVLATLPVHAILKEKIDATIEPMVILEVCSPRHAERALSASRDAGLLLPCKVVVSREEGRTRVTVARPKVLLGAFLPIPSLQPLGDEVDGLVCAAVDAAIR